MYKNYPRRKSIRLKNFNYQSNAKYFVTFCTESRLCLFGNIHCGKITHNEAGLMVHNEIATLAKRYLGVDVDQFIVMPNHVHAIIAINNDVGAIKSLSDVIRKIKTFTTRKYICSVHHNNWQPFERRLWQRGYYESIIRNEYHLNNIRKYIISNPENWKNNTKNRDCT